MGLLRHQIWKTSENKKTAKILPMLKSSLVELRNKVQQKRGERRLLLLKTMILKLCKEYYLPLNG